MTSKFDMLHVWKMILIWTLHWKDFDIFISGENFTMAMSHFTPNIHKYNVCAVLYVEYEAMYHEQTFTVLGIISEWDS